METTFDMFIETEVPEDELIVSRTDFSGKITYVNETLCGSRFGKSIDRYNHAP